jgi:hypothetical protein
MSFFFGVISLLPTSFKAIISAVSLSVSKALPANGYTLQAGAATSKAV